MKKLNKFSPEAREAAVQVVQELRTRHGAAQVARSGARSTAAAPPRVPYEATTVKWISPS